jgi:2-isopropylmalate synthase
MTGISVVCKDFQVHSVSMGKDAQAEVTVEAEYQGQMFRGRGISTDSIEASAKAFLDAINRVLALGVSPVTERSATASL